jgi:hypothetical protein
MGLPSSGVRALISPPLRLRSLSDRWVLVLRPLWVLVILFAIAIVLIGTTQALRDTYQVRPAFGKLGLDYDVENNGQVSVELVSASGEGDEAKWRITAINGAPVPAQARTGEIARRLDMAPGPSVALNLAGAGGQEIKIERQQIPCARTEERGESKNINGRARKTWGQHA